MKKSLSQFAFLCSILLCAASAWAQLGNLTQQYGAGAPSGNCPNKLTQYLDTPNGNLYTCPVPGAAWVLSGGGSGTPYSFFGNTANPLTALVDPTIIVDAAGNQFSFRAASLPLPTAAIGSIAFDPEGIDNNIFITEGDASLGEYSNIGLSPQAASMQSSDQVSLFLGALSSGDPYYFYLTNGPHSAFIRNHISPNGEFLEIHGGPVDISDGAGTYLDGQTSPPTGGSKGAGTLNSKGLYVNGAAVLTSYSFFGNTTNPLTALVDPTTIVDADGAVLSWGSSSFPAANGYIALSPFGTPTALFLGAGSSGPGASFNSVSGQASMNDTAGDQIVLGNSPTVGGIQISDTAGMTIGSPTGGAKGAQSLNVQSTIYQNNIPVQTKLIGTTGTITGTALTATCDSGTASITGAVVGSPVAVSSTTGADVGGAFNLRASVTSTGTVTVYVCGTGTPASLAYNVRVLP